MQVFKEGPNRKAFKILIEIPYRLENHQGEPTSAFFINGKEHIGCLGCVQPRCLYFSEDEIECDYIDRFPSDNSKNVCPVDALTWDYNENKPIVNNEKCFKCGICVSRCPVGALYFSVTGSLALNSKRTKYIKNKEYNKGSYASHLYQIEQLLNIPRTGSIMNASDSIFEVIYKKLSRLKSNYHDIVGRNLLLALGCQCLKRRIGDVYTRMDAVYLSQKKTFGAVEIEFGRDTLDAARGILDDIAVLQARYKINKFENKPLVICRQLPNTRQGYWQVVKDVKVVEGIKIKTITIGALILLLWYGCIFEPEEDNYYIDYDDMDLRSIICSQIGHNDIHLSFKKLGILEPSK